MAAVHTLYGAGRSTSKFQEVHDMPNSIHKFENYEHARRHFRQNKITDEAEKYAWIKKEYATVQLSMDALRAFFQNLIPGQDITVADEQVERRAAVSEQARHEYILIGVEHSTIPLHESVSRHLSMLFRPEVDEASRNYNAKFAQAIDNEDFATIAGLMDEFVQNLPSYDIEEIAELSDEEVVGMFHSLYSVYAITQEAAALLDSPGSVLQGAREHYSEATKQRLAQLEKDSGIFALLKLRCDSIANPHYAYIHQEKLMASQDALMTLVSNPLNVPSITLYNYALTLKMGAQMIDINLGRNVQRLLESDHFDLSDTKVCDSFNRDYSNHITDCKQALQSGDILYCTSGNRLKTFALEEGKLVAADPAAALDKAAQRSHAAQKKAGDILTGSLADPLWLLTGSSQYRAMKKELANYQKLRKGKDGQDHAKVSASLEKVKAAALEYLRYKIINVEEMGSFEHFKNRHLRQVQRSNSTTRPLSKRELARIEAAYSMLEFSSNAAGMEGLRNELSQMPALNAQQMSNNGAEPNRITRVSQLNQQLRQSAFLSEPMATDDNHTAENLRQEINDALFNPETGLLNKKFFTVQDRQQVETTLAKAVVLSAIRAGRKSMDNAPVPMEEAYQKSSETMLLEVKQNDSFRNLVGAYISPDGLRRFLAEQQYIGVSKDILSNAAKQAGNDQPMQQQRQAELQQERENQMEAAQPAMNIL